jgi:flagellar biosynthetic protein FliR
MDFLGIENGPVFALLAVRLGGLLLAAPLFGSPAVPVMVRGALAFVLAFLFAPLAGSPPAGEWTAGAFLLAAGAEAGIGLLIGFTASLLFAAVKLAGHLADQDMGISVATTLDPTSDEPIAVVSQFQTLLALVVYLLINGHHILLGAVAESLRALPVGSGLAASGASPGLVGDMAGRLFVVGLGLAIPALATLLLVTVAMALLARTVPEMNLLALGYPMRTLVGMVVLAVSVGFFARAFARAAADQEGILRGVMGVLGGRP